MNSQHTVLGSRVVRFAEISNVQSIHGPEFVQDFADRFSFWEKPAGPTEFDIDQGIRFGYGRVQQTRIREIRVFRNAVAIDCQEDTDTASDALIAMCDWAAEQYSFEWVDVFPMQFGYVSNLEIKLERPQFREFEKLRGVAKALDGAIASYGFKLPDYTPAGFSLQTDVRTNAISPGQFLIEKRVGHGADENIFYSEAPLRTQDHLDILKLL